VGQFGDDLEANLGALFKPTWSDAEKFGATIDLAMKIGEEIPILGLAVKLVAWREAWFGDGKKSERVTPVLVGLYERLSKLEAAGKDYIRKDEPEVMQALVEEALARIGDQPDGTRREGMQSILYKILEGPRDPAESRMFLRLADELPAPALKLLNATHGKVAPMVSTIEGLSQHTVDVDVTFWLKFLVSQGLVDEEQINCVQHGTYQALLTPVAKAFEEYRRS
jgi:hypothetical protein